MHILIDVTATARPDPTGIGNYARELIRAMFDIDRENHYTFGLRAKRFGRRKHILHMRQGRARIIPLVPPAYAFLRGRVHLFHALHNRLPGMPGFRKVVTIHDLDSIEASELFDPSWAAKQVRNLQFAIRRADAIITPSQFTMQRMLDRFPEAQDKSFAVHHGVDHNHYFPRSQDEIRLTTQRLGIDRPYILNIGAYNPRKNKINLLHAFARSHSQREGLLVFVGRPRGNYREVLQQASELGISDRVRFLGYVSREDIAPLLAGARIFAFPSIYEGFGLPVLEAMACGVPVLTSNLTSLPEVGENAVHYCEAAYPESISAELDRLWHNESERAELIERGLARASHFTWEKTARETLEVYRKVAPQKSPMKSAIIPPPPVELRPIYRPVHRVLLIAKDFLPLLGGAPILNANLSRIIHDMGYELRVLTWTAAENFKDEWPFQVERLQRPSEESFCPSDRIPEVLAEFRPDVILVSPTSKYMRPIFRALQKAKAPYVIYSHFFRLKHVRRSAFNRFLARRRYGYEGARMIAGVSFYLAEQLERMGVPKEKLRVVNPGIDPEKFQPDAELRNRMRKELGIEDRIVLLTVARLVEGKGQDRVIRALPELIRQYPKILYLVVGGGPNEEELQQQSSQLGLEKYVRFLGPQTNPFPYYVASDIFALPSESPGKWLDTFGLTLVEAGASGLPVIASSKGGPPEIVEDGKTGFLVDAKSQAEIVVALQRLIQDASLRHRMGLAGRERVVSRFTLRQSGNQVRDIFNELSRTKVK